MAQAADAGKFVKILYYRHPRIIVILVIDSIDVCDCGVAELDSRFRLPLLLL
jgi:hypothetical protein